MNEEKRIIATIVVFNSSNYHLWIWEIKEIVKSIQIWEYVNSNERSKSALAEHMSSSTEYNVTITINAAVNSSAEEVPTVSQSR